ncbi:MAG: FAD-dependent monooxygenase [Lachnospiraceae bacterium]|nr:FAD-dependent monooxygenase [Lachnospiraceae bacterium]
MLIVRQVKLTPHDGEDAPHRMLRLKKKTAALLKTDISNIKSIMVVKESVDARKKPEVFWVYTVNVLLENVKEATLVKKLKGVDVSISDVNAADTPCFDVVSPDTIAPSCGTISHKKVIVTGAGPAGLFAAYYLTLAGVETVLIERGKSVDERGEDVDRFWKEGILDPESNVLFGEGGAGTFSDGKLNTGIKDINGRIDSVLKTFVKFGAPSSILYEQHPHVGTDVLRSVIRNLRNEIISLGGEVRFKTTLTGMEVLDGKLCAAKVNGSERIACDALILAVGHSARDTFMMLRDLGMEMEPKSFAAGYRLMHEQSLINLAQYGEKYRGCFGAAPYKLTAVTSSGRGVYSFCMCPGGYVVNSSSAEGELCINGMSYSGRDGRWANSAIVVAVDEADYTEALKRAEVEFDPSDPLRGVYFQQLIEKRAYEAGGGLIPVQRFGDFMKEVDETIVLSKGGQADESGIMEGIKGRFTFTSLRGILPDFMEMAFGEAMVTFGRKIRGFDDPDALMAAVESRTSSPVRILREKDCVSLNIRGVYPCGEGAGYAGGIVSAAVDGIRVAGNLLSNP